MFKRVKGFPIKQDFCSFVIFDVHKISKYLIFANFLQFSADFCNGMLQYVRQVFEACDDLQIKKQFCYILARHVSRGILISFAFLMLILIY